MDLQEVFVMAVAVDHGLTAAFAMYQSIVFTSSWIILAPRAT